MRRAVTPPPPPPQLSWPLAACIRAIRTVEKVKIPARLASKRSPSDIHLQLVIYTCFGEPLDELNACNGTSSIDLATEHNVWTAAAAAALRVW